VLNDRLRERLVGLEQEFESVLGELNDPGLSSNPKHLREVSRRHRELDEVVGCFRRLEAAVEDLEAAREMVADSSGAERELAYAEVSGAESEIVRYEEELRLLLVPRDPNAGRNVILEIRGAEGGEEANLFAKDLYDMYSRYAAAKGWKVEVLASSPSERDGLNEITFLVKGEDAWLRLEHEGGPHRVQRVPVTESQGRIHTSTSTPTTSRSTSTGPPDLVASRSTPPTRPSASPISPPASSWPCRMRRARSRTGPKR
jgi:peptide chain release factor 1